MENINFRINTIVNELGLSNQEFGNAIGVTEATVRNLRGKANVGDIYIEVISLKWGYNKTWIKEGIGEKLRKNKQEGKISLHKLSEECLRHWEKLIEEPLFKEKIENIATKKAYEMTPSIVEKFRQEWEKTISK
ncbi:hypothetical protein FOF46_23400 [Aquimarina algiphila]|uniref:XRE family transcriptional regulator n=2 Tax=Aquimarina algiphila TaxID=2047982 RepID=A0A554VDZ1_9FLAO|nr:hypothetical protein [Aquimarina algiphila]TSE05212.1 hypothetical protein FOF46_23400 [Aquimarina algiphila]